MQSTVGSRPCVCVKASRSFGDIGLGEDAGGDAGELEQHLGEGDRFVAHAREVDLVDRFDAAVEEVGLRPAAAQQMQADRFVWSDGPPVSSSPSSPEDVVAGPDPGCCSRIRRLNRDNYGSTAAGRSETDAAFTRAAWSLLRSRDQPRGAVVSSPRPHRPRLARPLPLAVMWATGSWLESQERAEALCPNMAAPRAARRRAEARPCRDQPRRARPGLPRPRQSTRVFGSWTRARGAVSARSRALVLANGPVLVPHRASMPCPRSRCAGQATRLLGLAA